MATINSSPYLPLYPLAKDLLTWYSVRLAKPEIDLSEPMSKREEKRESIQRRQTLMMQIIESFHQLLDSNRENTKKLQNVYRFVSHNEIIKLHKIFLCCNWQKRRLEKRLEISPKFGVRAACSNLSDS